MASATKFIDFFIHDILDYTILNEGSKNFTKNINVFNVKHAINEIIDTMEDKVKMKDINVSVQTIGFNDQVDGEANDNSTPGDYLIKSDQKRIQQILLNLYANAIKFTERKGEISIIIEKMKDVEKKGQDQYI